MARILNPVLFSAHYGVDPIHLDNAGLINPFINVDTQLFIDPTLLDKSSNPTISKDAVSAFKNHFTNFIRLLSMSERRKDASWKGAERLLDLSEPPENGLGYGGSGRSGNSRPEEVRDAIMQTAKEIIVLGSKDPEMVSLMGFLEENVGADTISDFTTKVIVEQLGLITKQFCDAHGIPTKSPDGRENLSLPFFQDSSKKEKSLVLVPKDITRDLPIANDWGEIAQAIEQTSFLRDQINAMLSGIAKPTISDRKDAIREYALRSARNFEQLLAAVKEQSSTYDVNEDAMGYYKLKSILMNGYPGIPSGEKYDIDKDPLEVLRVANDTIDLFKHHVENGNLWEELWIGDKPKRERAAQLIYYAIADSYCKANNIDISPEANMGGGPVDFKFSKGYQSRILIEMKRSSGTVKHGYEKQLEFYKTASKTDFGVFVVIDFGDAGDKIHQINEIRNSRIVAGERASEIIVIDASKKLSASKRA